MKLTLLRRLALLLGLFAILGVLAVACGEEEEEGPTLAATTPAASPTAAAAKIGGAGIPSEPRQVRGLEGILTLDDGMAAWKERPATEIRTGVTADTIKLGRNAGVSGLIASVELYQGPALQAFIKRINEAGGIHGRKLELIIRDDQYNPTVAVQVVMELVEKDKVFGIFSTMGTAPHSAVASYLAENKVLEFWAAVGDYANFYPAQPFSFSSIDPHPKNGLVAGDTVLSLTPQAKVAFVGQGGDVGTGVGTGLAAATNPDWVAFGGVPTAGLSFIKALRTVAGYKGKVWQSCTYPKEETSELLDGVYSMVGLFKDGYRFPNDPQVLTVKKLLEDRGVRYNPNFSFTISYNGVETLVRALEIAGPDLTREGLLQAIYLGMDGSWKCTLCAVPIIYTPEDHFIDNAALPVRWNHAQQKYETLGPLKTYESSKGTSVIGNMPGFECQPPSADHPQGTCPWKSQ